MIYYKREWKHPDRIKAESAYKKALAASRKAEDETLEAFLAADKALDIARAAMVEAEIKHPTRSEARREANDRWMASIGLGF